MGAMAMAQPHTIPQPSDGAAAERPLRRRRADKEHDLFATIVEDAFSEIMVFDPQSLAILLANKSARSNLGYSAAEIGALRVTDVKQDYTAERLKALYQPILEGRAPKLVVHTLHTRKDGSRYPVEVHSRMSSFEGRPVIFQIVIDQTQIRRAHAQAELASAIERDASEAANGRDFLARLLPRLGRQFGSQLAHVYLWNGEKRHLESSGIWSCAYPVPWHADLQKVTEATALPSGIDLPGQVHHTRQAALMRKLAANPAFTRASALSGWGEMVGFAIPVLINQNVAAVLEFFFSEKFSVEVWPEQSETIGEQISRLYERKCAEESANDSRERFDAAVNGAAVGLWDYNYRNQAFYLSPRCRSLLHIAEHEAPPTWKEFGHRIHPRDVRRTAAAMKAHMVKRTPYDVEYRYRLSDGRYIWLRSRARGVWDDEGHIVRTAGTIDDITVKKEGEAVQRQVLASIAAPGAMEVKVTGALDRVCRYLGLDAAIVSRVEGDVYEVLYRSSGNLGPALKATLPLADTICSDAYFTDTLQAFPNIANSPAASHPARASGIEAYIGIAVFVKGRRFGTLSFFAAHSRAPFEEAEVDMVRLLARWIGEEIGRASEVAELIEDGVRTSAKLASAADALLTVNDKGEIEDANPAAAQMFACSPDELRHLRIAALLPTVKAFSHADGRLIAVKLRQDVAVRRDGRRLAVLLNITEIRLDRRDIYVVAISDLTAVKQAETAKGEFISVVSHELRTPLTSIRGALGLIVNQITGPLTPETAKLAAVAQQNCERLLRLVNDILALEKLESGQFEMVLQPVAPARILADAVAANSLYAAKFGAVFQLSVPPDLPMAIADAERLMQVMANLLSNAAKFTRPGSTVLVEATASGRHVQLSVRDRGNGIPAAIQSRIFEKFTQGESANTRGREGSGLGLSIARQMVECMNGDIRFESQEGVGTTFFVTLPTAEFGAREDDASARKAAA